MRFSITAVFALALLSPALLPDTAGAHPFHVTLSEAEWNGKTGRLEVAMRVYPNDLERALRLDPDKRIDLERTANVDQMITAYLSKAVQAGTQATADSKIRWIGKEVSLKHVWLYFEIVPPAGQVPTWFSNHVFFELESDQINTVNLKSGAARATLNFSRRQRRSKIPMPLQLALVDAPKQTLEEAVTPTAKGRVFHDANGNRQFDADEKTLADIRVSNGEQITRTDAEGKYELPVGDDTILFVIKPRGWRTPLTKQKIPQFYYIHKPAGSPEQKFAGVQPTGPLPDSVDFPLYPQEEPKTFEAILFGDPQPRDQKELDYLAHDVVEELIGSKAAFGVTLGDILFDDLALFDNYKQLIGLIGIPWYNVIGNHDINLDADHDHHSDETFESHFGPAYYSFDHGPTHFIVLDDVEWIVEKQKDGKVKRHYRGGLGKRQMEFVRNDLAMIPEDQLVVLLMHIPLVNVADRQDLYRMIEKRPFCMSISGHTHFQEHRFITKADGWQGPKPHHHVINVTACGSWWTGAPDNRGIPHATMSDGAPNGYSIISFDGQKYSLRFKAAGRPASYQMRIQSPEVVAVDKLSESSVIVNVFGGSEYSKTRMRVGEGSEWIAMKRTVRTDPAYVKLRQIEEAIPNHPWRAMSGPGKTGHIWEAPLPALSPGTHLIHVHTVDMFGQEYSSERSIRVTE